MSRLHAKVLSFVIALVGLTLIVASTANAHECETSCSSRCVLLIDEYQRIINANYDFCGGGGQPSCIPNCVARYSNGDCRQFGQDYCGRNPHCAVRCSARYANGDCREYAADICGDGAVACVSQCTSRYSSGDCREYGADICGRNPWCRTNCTARWPNGTCREYGADQCGSQAQ